MDQPPPKYSLMTKLRAVVDDDDGNPMTLEGFVVGHEWNAQQSIWLYKLNLEETGEFYDCFFAERELTPCYGHA